MKRIAPLFLLPLLIAACGNQSIPVSQSIAPVAGTALTHGLDYVASFEVEVDRDLTVLGLNGDLSGQAVAPKSYLNVLKVNESTARAYLKTTYPASTGCTLDWGDGSSATVTTPTPINVSTDQQNHAYTQSGTYTIKLTCGTNVKTSSFAAVIPVNELNLFDDFTSVEWFVDGAGGAEYTAVSSSYSTQGFDFLSGRSYMARKGGLAPGHNAIILNCTGTVQATSGALFDVKSLTGSTLFVNTMATAYDGDNNVIGSTVFSNDHYSAGAPAETRTLNWKNVKKIVTTCLNNAFGYILIDDMSTTIQMPPT